MAEDRMAVLDMLRKATADGNVDILREGVRVLAGAIMEAEVSELTGAAKGERAPAARDPLPTQQNVGFRGAADHRRPQAAGEAARFQLSDSPSNPRRFTRRTVPVRRSFTKCAQVPFRSSKVDVQITGSADRGERGVVGGLVR